MLSRFLLLALLLVLVSCGPSSGPVQGLGYALDSDPRVVRVTWLEPDFVLPLRRYEWRLSVLGSDAPSYPCPASSDGVVCWLHPGTRTALEFSLDAEYFAAVHSSADAVFTFAVRPVFYRLNRASGEIVEQWAEPWSSVRMDLRAALGARSRSR